MCCHRANTELLPTNRVAIWDKILLCRPAVLQNWKHGELDHQFKVFKTFSPLFCLCCSLMHCWTSSHQSLSFGVTATQQLCTPHTGSTCECDESAWLESIQVFFLQLHPSHRGSTFQTLFIHLSICVLIHLSVLLLLHLSVSLSS